MNSKEVKQKLYDIFNPAFSERGFKGKIESDGLGFYQKLDDRVNQISFGISNYSPLFKVGMNLSIGFTSLHGIEQKALGLDKKCSSTIYKHIGEYLKQLSYSYKIETEAEIESFYKIGTEFMENTGYAFFEKYTTLESIDTLMNTNPYSDPVDAGNIASRSRYGIIAAKLVNNPNFDSLVTAYRQRLQSGPVYLRQFEACVKFITEHSLDELIEIGVAKPGKKK
jgi:hypothetical protein